MNEKTGVLLVQLGGPQKREDLRPFLYELFSDPEIISIPFAPLRKAIAWFISTTRESKSAETYEKIGWSPIRCWSEKQALLLEAELKKSWPGPEPMVRIGMTCSKPFVEEPLEEFKKAGVTTLFVLPLYPQYSVTTTRSSHARVDLALKRLKWSPSRINAPDAWYSEPDFIEAHADLIQRAKKTLPDPDPAKTVLLYSAHSLPLSTIEKKKDPYPKQIEATVEAINNRLENRHNWRLGYQSKVGPMPWLEPSTSKVIQELAAEGARQVIAIPVAFVSDHVETLYEIRMLFGDEAKKLGITHYVAADGLNDHPAFIRALAAITRSSLGVGTAR